MPSDKQQQIAEKLRLFAGDWIGPSLRRSFRSLPSRIILSVFAAALVTSLVVTLISTRSIESFLHAKIDQKFPATLRAAAERMDLWYGQRALDVVTFARSETLVDNVARLGGASGEDQQARDELNEYLTYVLDRFPQYRSLLLLDREGRTLLHVGDTLGVPGTLKRRLAEVTTSQIDDMVSVAGERLQVASAAVGDPRNRVASLHAFLRPSAIEETLETDALGDTGRLYVVASDGSILLQAGKATPRSHHIRELPKPGAAPTIEEYQHEDGERVVGSAIRFDRFGWSIVVEEPYDDAFAPITAVIREILAINLGIVLVFGFIAYQIARSIVRPIMALSDAAFRIATGETDVSLPDSTAGDEIGVLTRAFNEMTYQLRENQRELDERRIEIEDANARLVAQNRELQRVNEVFQQLSITDDLTKLHNHRFFQDHLPREIKRSERTGEPLCLILIDIDDFKSLNDRFGHAVGDAVLRRVADVMHRSIREMDLLARYGGEEFVLLASRTALDGALALAEKIRTAIAQARFSVVDLDGPKEIMITASFGVAEYRGDERAFFNDADRALYRAKDAGKDCVVAAEPPSEG
jgi:diguanylate cyclase (GGDEF)-like protein